MDLIPGKAQTEILAGGVIAIAGLAVFRTVTRAASAHAPQLMVIARDLAAAVLAAAAVLVLLLAARAVARREGRHCEPPVIRPARTRSPRPARVQHPGEIVHDEYRLYPPAEAPAAEPEPAPLAESWRQ